MALCERSVIAVAVILLAEGCGQSFEKLPSQTMSPITGGSVDQGDPSVVAILGSSGGGYICTGTLIAPNLVLTAHHCVANLNSGGFGVSCTDGFGTNFSASSFVVTQSYNAAYSVFNSNSSWPTPNNSNWFGVRSVNVPPGTAVACGWDIALLELSHAIPSVCPTIPRVDSAPQRGETFTAIGFGITSPSGQAAGTRYKATGLTVQSSSYCGGSGALSSTYEWCGADTDGSSGTCEGDSGGPAMDSAGRVLGAVSRGPSDCSQTVYSGVYGWASWVKQIAQTAATNGGYTAAGWVTGASTSDPASGYCTSDGGVISVDGGSGGATDAGTPPPDAGTGSSGGGSCPSGLECLDGDGLGDYACFDPQTADGFPAGAIVCRSESDCPAGFGCWVTSQTATSGSCIQTCDPNAPPDGGTGSPPVRDGGTSTPDAGTGSGSGTADAGSGSGSGTGTAHDAGTGSGSTSHDGGTLPEGDGDDGGTGHSSGWGGCSASGGAASPFSVVFAGLVLFGFARLRRRRQHSNREG